ncbi:magnesium/cobalt transporter CorA [Bacillus xiapuensis]|uniref:magnesium/cobalt transporter CorA n=1 Tax=Bacillus xiapuensis TaxID=2014075 RepID=UPI000C235661|nr:magnesium/cobalt transporter CorA [Bacillus xiapuensis]
MIRTCIKRTNGQLLYNAPLKEMKSKETIWYWVDFAEPDLKEQRLLNRAFQFHPLAVEDCLDALTGRPKVDFYDEHFFFLLHALNRDTLEGSEVDVFINERMLVTFHKQPVRELDKVWERINEDEMLQRGPAFILHSLIDSFVDEFFPPVYRIEDQLNNVDEETDNDSGNELIDRLFDIRHDMAKLRRSIFPMRDLVYRMLNSTRLEFMKDRHLYYRDVYDHLLKLVEMLESYRDFSSDVRDNYLSVNSDKMNKIMMTLTVITTIFMPLTFIAGIYGMNFSNMPELEYRYGYFITIGTMAVIALLMFLMFFKAGWLSFGKKNKKRKRKITFK